MIDLNCGKGSNQILDIDRFSVPKGSVVALIGDNGCGKSTLSEVLCGLIPANGSIGFEGKYLNAKERTRKSFLVMQDVNRQLFSESVIEEVCMQYDITKDEARKTLSLLGIEELSDRHHASLSGGQKQRVAIASAICAKKDILFYDEPTSGLDRSGMENFGRLLNETIDADNESQIQAALFKLCEGKTTMVIAHRLNTIKKADKILVLDKGQILQEGRHEELMKVDGAYRNMILAGGMEDE